MPADHAVGSGECHPGKGHGHCLTAGPGSQSQHMAAVAAGPSPLLPSEPELIRATLFVCFVNRHQEAPSGLCRAPSPSLAARNPKQIFQCGFCGLGMYFRILIWRPRAGLRALPLHSLVSISAPPILRGAELKTEHVHSHPIPSQPLLGQCHCGKDGGTSPGDVEHPWTHLGWAPAGGANQSWSQPAAGHQQTWKQLPSRDLLETPVERPPLNGPAGDSAAFGGHWSHLAL